MRVDLAFNVEVATAYGLEVAVITHHVAYWVFRNEANDVNIEEGRGWTYNSARAYTELYPFWTQNQVKRILKQACDRGALLRGNYNKVAYDRTLWYSISDRVRQVYGLDWGEHPDAKLDTPPSRVLKATMEGPEPPDQYQVKNTGIEPVEYPIEFHQNLGDNMDFDIAWREWLKERRERGKKMTDRAQRLALQKLVKLSGGDTQLAIQHIAHAIERGWTGFYPMKNHDKRSNKVQDTDGSSLRQYLEQMSETDPK